MISSKDNFPKSKSISILGFGWLGKSVCESFLALGYSLKVSTTSEDKLKTLMQSGLNAFKINLDPEINEDFDSEFFNSENLICCIPPRRRDDIEDFHPAQFSSLISKINDSKIKNVLFIGSTSVYGDLHSYVDENTLLEPTKKSGKALFYVENLLKTELKASLTILRFGGLIGYDRIPGRFLAGKVDIENGLAPVNLIHRDDCVSIINEIVEQGIWNNEFNACCPEHPSRDEFYSLAAKVSGYIAPKFILNKNDFKLIDPKKISETLKYKFIYKNPLDCLKM